MLYATKPITRIPNLSCVDPYSNCDPSAPYNHVDGYIYKYGPEYIVFLWQNTGDSRQDREVTLTTNDSQITLFDSLGNQYPLIVQQNRVKVWVPVDMVIVRGFTQLPTFALESNSTDAPSFVTRPPTTAVVNNSYYYNAWAYDSDVPSTGNNSLMRITYTLIDAPTGMTLSRLDNRAGLITWIPTSPGAYPVTIQATSTHGVTQTVDQTFTIQVADEQSNFPPFINSQPISNFANVGSVWRYNATAYDPNNHDITYSLQNAPIGMAIDPQSGFVQWQPIQAQTVNFTVLATDILGVSTAQSVTITANSTNGQSIPLILYQQILANWLRNTPYYDLWSDGKINSLDWLLAPKARPPLE